ncbi:uncharacterized protein MONOS_8724 [Monocercomonoides exilis]|uniref:uncharacterized protein n=1 Tax=Monocercomonoides exilis TaxID=2049356 RepID=UPI00355A5B62|nr:hypothetical protein MONOS_8724 [Monocercomonoides exilis]|eukprot:MONOS_8724.1-p1 / transcript=MONOS_8724.1 / gene=MONOS_8724 / organism=Monocercomonoides_exilis_PA203 / gene_product=unspecified product / transcript_product=unspecified product / location=Mono_scaffold00336:39636-40549(-) / protein_length=213 / sequence_SO=supercontig / SO=protein_coding / is_pseudo=false
MAQSRSSTPRQPSRQKTPSIIPNSISEPTGEKDPTPLKKIGKDRKRRSGRSIRQIGNDTEEAMAKSMSPQRYPKRERVLSRSSALSPARSQLIRRTRWCSEGNAERQVCSEILVMRMERRYAEWCEGEPEGRIRLVYAVRDDRVCSADATEEREAESCIDSFLFHASRKREWFFFLLQDYSPHRIPAQPAGESSEGQCPLPSGLRDQGEKAK